MITTIRLNVNLIKNMSKVLFMPAAEIVAVTKLNRSTYYRIVESPRSITVQQLLVIANRLHIPARRFFLTGKDKPDVTGKRDDYITEPYDECCYDADMLQSIVDARSDISWQKAADATGVTRDNLRHSLLAVTHTPVVRFLTACEVWGIDPFTILTDPNPEPVREQKRKGRKQGQDDLLAEIGKLRNDIRALSDTVDDLTGKYQELLEAHAALARRVSVNFENVNGSHINIATEDLLPLEPDK